MELSELAEQVEKISAGYAAKNSITRDATWFLLKLHEEVGELTQAFLASTGQGRARGKSADELAADVRDELADVLCQTLLLARDQGVDLPAAVAAKWLVWGERG
ncbi:MazG nucleotide pyrophosphohydrolase domain-containing protein [Nocardia camponoti]|nr:MazG nucleotide pyrophosphohydrolase domain-containing protein [Nocardia camponoti]